MKSFCTVLSAVFTASLLVVAASCVAEVEQGDSGTVADRTEQGEAEEVGTVEQDLSQPALCVDTIDCGGCCGSQNQVKRFLACCQKGGGFSCVGKFGCQ